ncbi:MAG TPA: electron transfer flavoprotein subunit alpha/FixB family protein [Saprospiraceae bacterium]|nr:electron transfer flavoprotein subunit alpha/FixB family protein [Saprospiraceae bacterium]
MIMVFAETQDGKIKRSALESVYYGSKIAAAQGTTCTALVLGQVEDGGKLGSYGAKEVWQVNDAKLASFDSQTYADVISKVAADKQANVIILPDSSNGKSLTGLVAVKLKAGVLSGVNKLPEWKDGKLYVERALFSGKAFASCRIDSTIAVLSIAGNTLKPVAEGSEVAVTPLTVEVPDAKTKVLSVNRSVGIVPLPEAEVVVSAGRGMKDPSNWGIVEDLASVLGATTACSRPVADSGWRPHHEHVGQTGIAIRPNLYIAIGISGAIQHLAGVNSSKVIVVINKDPEAPFFKAADYGVVGDLFEVVPRLTEAIKKLKSAGH